jgi:hypothetical protein
VLDTRQAITKTETKAGNESTGKAKKGSTKA